MRDPFRICLALWMVFVSMQLLATSRVERERHEQLRLDIARCSGALR